MKFDKILRELEHLPWLNAAKLEAWYLKERFGEDSVPFREIFAGLRHARREAEVEAIIAASNSAVRARLDAEIAHCESKTAEIREMFLGLIQTGGGNGSWVATGRRSIDAPAEVIPARYWAHLKLDLATASGTWGDLVFFDLRFVFRNVIPANNPLWAARADDAMSSRGTAIDESTAAAAETITPTRTGAPGRPTSMHLVEQEFHRRSERGCLEVSLARQAAALAAWLARTRPDVPHLTAKTIENKLRGDYRAAISRCVPATP